MALGQLVQDLPEVHSHALFFYFYGGLITNTVNAMRLTTLKLPKSFISDYPELGRQTQGPAGVHLFYLDQQLLVSYFLNILTLTAFFNHTLWYDFKQSVSIVL